MTGADNPNIQDDPTPAGPTAPTFEQVNADYQRYLNRQLTQQEYDQYWANATNYDSSMVANSQEALALANQNVPGTGQTDPTVPIAPANQTGQGGPPPQQNPTPPPQPPPGQGPQVGPPTQTSTNPGIPIAPGGAPQPPPGQGPQVGPPSGANPGAPTFTPPTYTPPPAFSYADFVAPDPQELQNDPNFKYTLKTEQDAINRSAAARGVLNTGGTINDLLVNANDVTSQGYQNLWTRKMGEYAANRGNAVDAYNTNYKTQYVDPYTFADTAAQDMWNANSHNFDQGQFYTQHNIDQNQATATHNTDLNRQFDWYKTLFGYQQQQDEWDRKFKLLGLI